MPNCLWTGSSLRGPLSQERGKGNPHPLDPRQAGADETRCHGRRRRRRRHSRLCLVPGRGPHTHHASGRLRTMAGDHAMSTSHPDRTRQLDAGQSAPGRRYNFHGAYGNHHVESAFGVVCAVVVSAFAGRNGGRGNIVCAGRTNPRRRASARSIIRSLPPPTWTNCCPGSKTTSAATTR